ncbi:hypothetical protein R1flu_027940 [Riccia fluitans]|uniref:Uncharacterized protein n=1 Tax=Riccia fluitans TaxID=41844 RepID=A0ABD1XK94_9MARC
MWLDNVTGLSSDSNNCSSAFSISSDEDGETRLKRYRRILKGAVFFSLESVPSILHNGRCYGMRDVPQPGHPAVHAVQDDEPTVKFIWVTTQIEYLDEDEPFESPNLEEYFGKGKNGSSSFYNMNRIRNRPLKQFIELRHRDTFLIDGSPLNQAVAAVVPATVGNVWRGPLIALKCDAHYRDYYDHMDLRDLRDVADYLTRYGQKSRDQTSSDAGRREATSSVFGCEADRTATKVSPEASAAPKSKTVKGVRVNCLGDIKSGRPEFEAVELAINRRKGGVTSPPLPARLGIPLELQKITPPNEWKQDSIMLQNPVITFLHLESNPTSTSWGWAPLEWQSMVGSVVMARADGKDLRREHAETLCHYCYHFLQPVFEDSIGAGMDPEVKVSKEEVLYRLSPKSFELFCLGFFKYKEDTDRNWAFAFQDLNIIGSPAKVKGLHNNFHKLRKFL